MRYTERGMQYGAHWSAKGIADYWGESTRTKQQVRERHVERQRQQRSRAERDGVLVLLYGTQYKGGGTQYEVRSTARVQC